jgi:hypothetical protein
MIFLSHRTGRDTMTISKIDEQGVEFTLNQYFIFSTTPEGDDLIRRSAAEDADLIATAKSGRYCPTLEDLLPPKLSDGRWEMPAWQFMSIFGPTFTPGGDSMIVDDSIELGKNETERDF